MKVPLLLIPVLAVSVVFLIRAEFRKNKQQICIIKSFSTILVIAVSLLSFLEQTRNSVYTFGMMWL
jgi:hypothetical protein